MSDEDGKIDALVSEVIAVMEPGSLVTGFMVIAEGLDAKGDRTLFTIGHNGAATWQMLGMSEFASTKLKAQITKREFKRDS